MTIFERANHRLLVNHLSPRRIHDNAPPFHRPNLFLAHEIHRVVSERHVHAQHVRLRTQRFQAWDVLAPRGGFWDAVTVVVYYAHWEGVHEVRETEADAAQPEDAEGAVGEVVCVPRGDRGFPRACKEGAFGL